MKNLIPKRRFEEFKNSDPWEQRKLEEVIENMYNGQTPSRFSANNWGGNINWLSSGELNRGIVTETIEKITPVGQKDANLRIVPKGTFVIAITGLEAEGTRGNCAKLAIDTTLNQSCMALFPKQNILDSDFLFQWYRKVGDEYGIEYTQGTKQQSYNAELIKILPITLPKIEEQKKLARFLDNLDNLITLHQRKLDKLKETKSAYLSEMFPKEGELYPKRRFAGFTDPWEQRKLSDVMSDFIVPMRDKPKEFSGNTPWTRIEDIEGKYLNGSLSGQHVSSETIKKMNLKIIPRGSLIVSASATFGVVAIVTQDLITNQTFIGLVPERDYDLDFLYVFFQSPAVQKKMKLESAGSTIFYISRQTFENMEFLYPNYSEQKKIGSIFSNLDNLITLHQRKLDKLQALKQAYLSEMFV